MAQYELNSRAKARDGSVIPFHVVVESPETAEDGTAICRAFFTRLNEPAAIRASTPEEAYFLALYLVKCYLEAAELTLLDVKGNRLQLPVPRGFEDEWNRKHDIPGVLPRREAGFPRKARRTRPTDNPLIKKRHAICGAVDGVGKYFSRFFFVRPLDSDGRRRRIHISVGAPEQEDEYEFKCRVFFSPLGKPIYIRSVAPDHAHYLAFNFVRQSLEYERLELIDAKGNPIELPYPPEYEQDLRPC